MPRQKTCPLCNKPIILNEDGDSIESTVPYKNNRLVHKKCFDHIMKGYVKIEKGTTKQKEQAKKQAKQTSQIQIKSVETEKEGLTEEEYRYKKTYYTYLRECYGTSTLPTKYYALTERYRKSYNFTFAEMYQTLIYLYEVQDKEFNEDTGNVVALIPYYYEEAQAYYSDIEKCGKNNKDKDINKMYHKRVVNIPKIERKKRGETWEF